MNIPLLSYIFVFVVTLPLNVSADEREYIYKSWNYSWGKSTDETHLAVINETFTIDTKKKVAYLGHAGHPYTTCPEKEVCIRSFGFNFYLPDKGLSLKKWFSDGFNYINKGEAVVELFGVKHSLYKIQVINSSNDLSVANPLIVYYSANAGILGFTKFFYDDDIKMQIPETYWSVGSRGFGHQK